MPRVLFVTLFLFFVTIVPGSISGYPSSTSTATIAMDQPRYDWPTHPYLSGMCFTVTFSQPAYLDGGNPWNVYDDEGRWVDGRFGTDIYYGVPAGTVYRDCTGGDNFLPDKLIQPRQYHVVFSYGEDGGGQLIETTYTIVPPSLL